jgi:hypothetical protein
VKETVKDATIERVMDISKKAGSTVGSFVRSSSRTPGTLLERFKNNPIPMTLAGIEAARLVLRELEQFRSERLRRAAAIKDEEREVPARRRRTARNSARFVVFATGAACLTTWAIWKLRSSPSTVRSVNSARPASETSGVNA